MEEFNSHSSAVSKIALRRQREKEQRFRAVLDAAETLFAQKGYHQTSIEEIADLAEVSTGTVYFYFRNKEDLLIKLMHEIGYYLRDLLGTELNKTELSLESLRNIAYAFFRDFCILHPEKISIFFRESVGQSPEVEKQRKSLFIKLTLDIKEAIKRIVERLGRRFMTDSSPEVIAVCIVGIYERVACHYFLWHDHPTVITDIDEESITFMLGGVENLLDP